MIPLNIFLLTCILFGLSHVAAWLHGVSWQSRHAEPAEHPLLDVAPAYRPERFVPTPVRKQIVHPARSRTAAQIMKARKHR
jgi:hypothetical protein